MRYYLGLDLHSATFTLAVINSHGDIIGCYKKDTSEYHLIALIKELRKKAKISLVVEESHMAGWCQETIKRYCDEFIVCDPRENKLISEAEFCNDKEDAIKLAKLLRAGFIKPIIHQEGEALRRRELFLHYYSLTTQNAANKMKLKAIFRMNAIPTRGDCIYNQKTKRLWLDKLPHKTGQLQANHYYAMIESLDSLKENTKTCLKNTMKHLPEYTNLKSFPGIGETIAMGLISIIGTPLRFSRKNKLWKYAGYGVKCQMSDGVVYSKKASKTGNRVLKWLVSEIFRASLRCTKEHRFKTKYIRLITKGVSDKKARRTVSRDILSAIRAAWIKKECFRN
jgi:transposase